MLYPDFFRRKTGAYIEYFGETEGPTPCLAMLPETVLHFRESRLA